LRRTLVQQNSGEPIRVTNSFYNKKSSSLMQNKPPYPIQYPALDARKRFKLN